MARLGSSEPNANCLSKTGVHVDRWLLTHTDRLITKRKLEFQSSQIGRTGYSFVMSKGTAYGPRSEKQHRLGVSDPIVSFKIWWIFYRQIVPQWDFFFFFLLLSVCMLLSQWNLHLTHYFHANCFVEKLLNIYNQCVMMQWIGPILEPNITYWEYLTSNNGNSHSNMIS